MRARAEPRAQTFISHRSQVAHIISFCALPQLASLLPPELAVSADCAPTLPRYPKPEAFLHSLLPHEELAGKASRAVLGFSRVDLGFPNTFRARFSSWLHTQHGAAEPSHGAYY